MKVGINRNILECKADSSRIETGGRVCINRNILECKELPDIRKLHPENRINRNILECKVNSFQCDQQSRAVLIETYWNVKIFIPAKTIFEEKY